MNLPIIGSTDDVFTVESDAPDEFLVSLKNPQARAALDVPQSNRVVAAATDYELVAVLQTRDTTFVPAEGPDEFARRRVPDFDCAVAARGDDIFLVEVHDVHGRPVTHQDAPQGYFGFRRHVPYGYRAVLLEKKK